MISSWSSGAVESALLLEITGPEFRLLLNCDDMAVRVVGLLSGSESVWFLETIRVSCSTGLRVVHILADAAEICQIEDETVIFPSRTEFKDEATFHFLSITRRLSDI